MINMTILQTDGSHFVCEASKLIKYKIKQDSIPAGFSNLFLLMDQVFAALLPVLQLPFADVSLIVCR